MTLPKQIDHIYVCNFQILIGPRDWDDYLLSKEGAERYRTHNLPNCSSCPGLYELGIAVPLPHTESQNSSKPIPKKIIPVYLGQADNVRTRLQQYGRDGAHLENGWSNRAQFDRKVLGLFSDIFSYGFGIAFRWAPMDSKKEAEKKESQLLKTFDYAWNRGMNGERRPVDIHQKLTVPSTKRVPLVFNGPKRVGLNCDPPTLENRSSFYTKQKDTNTLPEILKFNRSRPTLVSNEREINNSDDRICGVGLGHGSICTRPPVEGRKRCVDHKGMKVNASVKLKPGLVTNEDTCHVTCGVTLYNGCICTRVPVAGRKRCEEHKGMRVGEPNSRSGSDSHYWDMQKSYQGRRGIMVNWKNGADSMTCAAVTRNGSFCRRKPGQNSMFCWQHH